ncbi:MgtC/SapB family protein [Cryobacterium aureum]|uniref:MgtC/SapB family protein n=1 Tax=Cryobacterium aureum TaxID=995037 RepID=UPI001F0C52FD|nr:MgtC/SapB family protein [Cryobacterium aureum]
MSIDLNTTEPAPVAPEPSSPNTTQVPPARPAKVKKPLNVVGLVALIAAALGFIFACIPGALIIGWILLPIAFVLALVSLFLKGKGKWMGITALIVSIVGTVVGVSVFLAVVASSVDDAFGSGGTTVVEPSDGAGADAKATENKPADDAETRKNPYPIGSVIESDDWRVVINSVTLASTDWFSPATSSIRHRPRARSTSL